MTVSDQYWAMLMFAKEQGMLETLLSGDAIQIEMINTSQNKSEYEAKLSAFASKVGSGFSVSFANGKMTLVLNGQTSTVNYVEHDGIIYVSGRPFFYVDAVSGNIYEYNADDYTATKHIWTKSN